MLQSLPFLVINCREEWLLYFDQENDRFLSLFFYGSQGDEIDWNIVKRKVVAERMSECRGLVPVDLWSWSALPRRERMRKQARVLTRVKPCVGGKERLV